MSWGPADRQRLRQARSQKGHNQTACARALSELGSTDVSQASVSNWETGRIGRPQPDALWALEAYIGSAGLPDAIELDLESAHARLPVSSSGAETMFDALVRSETGEPLLGLQQQALVTALIDRLRQGPPLSEADDEARRWLLDVLRVPQTHTEGNIAE
jgi:transcriptional regulator with XRE-family HTH domain